MWTLFQRQRATRRRGSMTYRRDNMGAPGGQLGGRRIFQSLSAQSEELFSRFCDSLKVVVDENLYRANSVRPHARDP